MMVAAWGGIVAAVAWWATRYDQDADAALPKVLEILDGTEIRSLDVPKPSFDEVFFLAPADEQEIWWRTVIRRASSTSGVRSQPGVEVRKSGR